MIRKTIILIFTFVFAAVSVKASEAKQVNAVTSILPLVEFVKNVGGDNVNVSVMIPPGGNPHTYEPTPGQMKDVSKADLYVKVGTDLEFEIAWLDKLLALNKKMHVCDSSKGIRLISFTGGHSHEEGGHHHGNKDPHIWLSPLNAIIMTGNIRDSLIEIDPDNKDTYEQNAEKYIIELNRLNSYIKDKLKNDKGKTFMVFHPAWGYYAADYGIKEMSVEYCSKEPTPKQMARLIDEAKEHGIKVIFVSPQFSKRSAEAIAKDINGRVRSIDPLAEDYIENLKKVTDTLAGAE